MVLSWESRSGCGSPRSRVIRVDPTALHTGDSRLSEKKSALSVKSVAEGVSENCSQLTESLQIRSEGKTDVPDIKHFHTDCWSDQRRSAMFSPKWSFSDDSNFAPNDRYSSKSRVKIGDGHQPQYRTESSWKRISLNFEPNFQAASTLVRVSTQRDHDHDVVKSKSFGNLACQQSHDSNSYRPSTASRQMTTVSSGYHSSYESGHKQGEKNGSYLVGSFRPSRTRAKWIGSDSEDIGSTTESIRSGLSTYNRLSKAPCFKRMIKSTTLPTASSRFQCDKQIAMIPEEPFSPTINGRLTVLPMVAVKRLKRFSHSHMDTVENDRGKTAMVLTKRMLITEADREVFEISLFSDDSYEPGDLIAIKPQNISSKVTKLLRHYGISDRHDYFCLKGAVSVFSEPITFATAFAEILDLSAPVPVDFLLALENEIGPLPYELNARPIVPYGHRKSLLNDVKVKDICDVIDVLRSNGRRLPSLELLLIHLPKIRSRKYFITSAGNGVISFSFRPRKIADCHYGLASDYLISLKSRDFITATVVPGSNFNLPPSLEVPIVMFVGELGILAVRSILESRRLHKIRNRLHLLYKVKEGAAILYREEIFARKADRTITELVVTTERTRKVLDFLESNTHWQQLITDTVTQGGHIYVSGKATFCKEMRKFLLELTEDLVDTANDFYHEESGGYSCETFEIL